MPTIIYTFSGHQVDIENPTPEAVDMADVAHALAYTCRWGGHSKRFWSVAQHSVLVSAMVPSEHALAGLLHDAAEAYLGDVVAPLKRLLGEPFAKLERGWLRAIGEHCGVELDPLPEAVRAADARLMQIEQGLLLPLELPGLHQEPDAWDAMLAGPPTFGNMATAMAPEMAFDAFGVRWIDLARSRHPDEPCKPVSRDRRQALELALEPIWRTA